MTTYDFIPVCSLQNLFMLMIFILINIFYSKKTPKSLNYIFRSGRAFANKQIVISVRYSILWI